MFFFFLILRQFSLFHYVFLLFIFFYISDQIPNCFFSLNYNNEKIIVKNTKIPINIMFFFIP
jgi:hypothetical protein